ncbi:MAG: hypothetical protein KIT83_20925 [Bryobacterales bacterium]|nr:hypothetical protein [Bryobacterales bacterium]
MNRSSICIIVFGFALVADFFTGPLATEVTIMDETPSAALALGPLAFVFYRWYARIGNNRKELR